MLVSFRYLKRLAVPCRRKGSIVGAVLRAEQNYQPVAMPVKDPETVELSVVMPCLNEAETLESCIGKAQRALREADIAGEVIVADNGSTDGNAAQALRLAAELRGVRLTRLSETGRGRALAESWLTSDVGGPALCRRDGRRSHDLRPDRAEFLISGWLGCRGTSPLPR